jgi:5S rRNA maturation endonuclease (ribonuclease M5)
VCGGSDDDPRGHGTRCHGYQAGDWVCCSREEFAGRAKYRERSQTYAHRLRGPCPCGVEHAPGEAGQPSGASRKRPIETIYRYRDAEGRVVFEVVRFKDRKDFRQRRPTGDGRYAWNLKGIEPILYRLTELLAASKEEVVWLCEGEKDADRLASLGQVATCNPMGAGKWRDHYAATLEGRRVIVLPDNDDPGRDHARQVAGSLVGRAASIKVLELPDLLEKGDVSDFLDAGGTVERLRELVEGVPEWMPPPSQGDSGGFSSFSSYQASREPASVRSDPPIVLPQWPTPPDPAAYSGLAGEIIRTIAPESEADPVALLLQVLIAFGNILGRRAHIAVDAARHHTNEFAVLVGETSAGRKGQSWRQSRQFVAASDPDWDVARIQSGLSSGEGVIYHVRDPIRGREPIRKKGEITSYRDVVKDEGVEDKRLLLFEPEFGGVLQALRRDGNKLSAIIRQAWDSDTLSSLTKDSPYRATGAHISLVGHITAEELTRLLSLCEQANGFANRILWCCVRRSKWLPFGGRPDPQAVAWLQARMREVVAFARRVEQVDWTPEAMPVWEEAYRKLATHRPGAFGMATSRAEAHTLRLALLYTLLDGCDRIGPSHLRAALALWDYCERSAAYVFGNSLADREAQAILDALRGAPEGMNRTEIRLAVFHNHRPAHHVAAKLAILLKMRLVRSERVETAGRTAERWFVADALLDSSKSSKSPEMATEADDEGWVEI